jgi:hypothetical protein
VTNLATIEDKQAIATETQENEDAFHRLEQFQIQNQEDFELAGEALKWIKERWKNLEERRTRMTKPINEGLRQINDFFRPAKDPLERAEAILKSKVGAYTLAQREAQAKAMQEAAAAVQAGQRDQAAALVQATAPTPQIKGIAVKAKWAFRVVNEALVPREYLSVDPVKLEKAIWYADTERTPPRPIPGIEFFLETSTTVRTK